MGRPLLLAHQVTCDGPWTPTKGLDGIITAKGLKPGEDEVVIRIRDMKDPTEMESDLMVTIQCDAELNIGPIAKALIQACHTMSSGNEVFVWVA